MFGQMTDQLPQLPRRLFRATIILFIVGLCFTVIGACMPFWYIVTDTIHAGVFQSCLWAFKRCSSNNDDGLRYKDVDFYDLLWGLTLTGMFLLLLSLGFLFMYIFRKTVDHCKIAIGIFVSVCVFIGIVLILAALIIYVDALVDAGVRIADVFEDIGWAWYMTLLGLVLLVAGFVCFILHMFFMVYGSDDTPDLTTRSYTNQQTSNRDYYGRQRRH